MLILSKAMIAVVVLSLEDDAQRWLAPPSDARAPADDQTEPVGDSSSDSGALGSTDEMREEPIQEAQRLFKEARVLYGTADYTGALALLTAAYRTASQIEDDEDRTRILRVLEVNLAQAHVEAWKIDGSVEHLRLAKTLLNRHLSRDIDENSESRNAAEVLMEFVDASLAEETDGSAEEVTSSPSVPLDNRDDQPEPVEQPGADRGRMSPMKIAGYTALGCSGLGLGLMGGGMAIAAGAQERFDTEPTQAGVDDAERLGRTGNAMAIAGAASAGVFAATGVVLLVLEKRRLAAADRGRSARLDALTPTWSPETIGVSLGGRF